MDRLPSEIFVDIFSHLAFKDKLECALTCRNWYAKIVSTVLYSKVGFKYHQNNERTRAKIEAMYNDGSGSQISDLRINGLYDPLELSEICPNLKSLEVHDWMGQLWKDKNNACLAQRWKKLECIKESRSLHSLITKLLGFRMTNLTTLDIDLYYQQEDVLVKFIQRLKRAPALEHLTLEKTFYMNYKKLDLLHKNSPNLKDLNLVDVNCLLVEEEEDQEEYDSLPVDPDIASNLRSFSAVFESEDESILEPDSREINGVRWIEYICHKYTNLCSVTVNNVSMLSLQQSKDITTRCLQKAFGNWIHLAKFDIQSVYLSTDIFQAMDESNIHLKQIKMYVNNNEDMKQFINLADSKQANSIEELVIQGDTEAWYNQEHWAYLLQSLDRNRLKEIDINMQSKMHDPNDEHYVLTPNQIVHHAPRLQRLAMLYACAKESICISYNQTTLLKNIELKLGYFDIWNDRIQQQIQDLIYASPLLESFSIIIFSGSFHGGLVFDFQLNTKLKRMEYFTCLGDVIGIVQNNQLKRYTFCYKSTEVYPTEIIFRKELETNDSACRAILYLPHTIHSLIINRNEYPL